ncbi:MAG: YdcF family protein [Eubacteriales bacterium]|nr:YdcF family protein [Eubacteriales bacterium]
MYRKFLKEIEDFIFMEDQPEQADIIFVPGNGYPYMAEKAAELYVSGMAPVILPSGKYSISYGKFSGVIDERKKYNENYETEWEFLKDVLVKNGVPESAVLKEDKATFTWQNALFSKKVTDLAGINVRKAILCCKNYHARRAFMYYQRAYPETEFLICPCSVDEITKETWKETQNGIDEVMAETKRIISQFQLMM